MSVLFTRRGPAPKTGTPASDLEVGGSIFLNVGGTLKEFLIVHQGKPSSLYDDSCDGTWLLMKDIYETREWNSSYNSDYNSSTIHSYLNSTFLGLLDAGVQNLIKSAIIPYSNGQGSYVYSGANGLSTKIFLPSGLELGFAASDMGQSSDWADGACLNYFTSNAASKRMAYLNGAMKEYWLRSPYESGVVNYVAIGGGCGSSNAYGNSYGIRPALILPSNAKIDPETRQLVA